MAVRVLTELVSPGQYGRLSLVTGLVSLVSLVVYTSLGRSANRFAWDYANQRRSSFWVSSVVFTFVLVGLLLTLVLAAALALGFDSGISPWIAAWTIPLFLVAGAVSTTILGVFNTLREHRVFVIGTVAYAWLQPGLAVLMVLVLSPTAESIMQGYALSSVLMLLGVLCLLWKRGLLQLPDRLIGFASSLREILLYTAPFMLVYLFYWVQTTANRYVLDFNLGVDQVGVFVVAVAIARVPVQSVESVFTQIHQPILFQRIGQREGQAIDPLVRRQSFSAYLAAFLVITLPVLWFTIFGANVLMRLLAGQAYWAGVTIIPWVALAEFLRALTAVFTVAFEVERRPRSLLLPIALASLITLILTFVLSRLLGILGAGIALAVGTFAWLILLWIPALRLACWAVPWIDVFKALGISLLISGVAYLVGRLAGNLGFVTQSVVFVAIFGLGYLLYAGRKLLG